VESRRKKRSKQGIEKRLEEAFAKTILSFTCGLVTNSPPEQPDYPLGCRDDENIICFVEVM
jgi:hypothetical protein